MNKPLLGEKLAVLVANGFNEQDLVRTQRIVQDLGADMRIVSMDQGLVNSWRGTDWGLNFASDNVLNEALAADYSMLAIPGGQRSIDKLKLTAHTRRFINGFIGSAKPVLALAEAVELLEFADVLAGRRVAGQEETYAVDANLMTGISLDDADEDYINAIKEFLVADYTLNEAA